jgi:3-dehydroquinate synthase
MRKISLTTPTGATSIAVGTDLSTGLCRLDPEPFLLVDEQVLRYHSNLFTPLRCLIIPSGEQYKTLQTVENLFRELVMLEADRSSLLVGVGGGLATDIAGFVASTYLRGVRFGFVSTTLLGQVDASIGGKNGVNLDGYKNLIGTIRQPEFVWCDLSLLQTLARSEYISGIAEVIKYGAVMEEGFLYYLKDHMEGLLALDHAILEEVVTRSVRVKAGIVERDEKESGPRRILNFGHTIGHAIERDRKVLHGQAVSVGMVMACRLSVNLGMLHAAGAGMIEELLSAAGLPIGMALDPEALYANIRKDKKKSGEAIHLVLLEGPGRAIVRSIALKEFKRMLHDLC